MTHYPTDLTEKQWQVIKNILDPQARNRKHPLKEIMNAILYINKTGRMFIQNSGTVQTLDCVTLFLMVGKLQKADHRL